MPTSLGPAEILVILVVALLVLGPKRLPDAGRQVGKAIAEVRKWSQGFQDEVRTVMDPAPSYPPPQSPLPPLPGPATPADSEYAGPTPETAPPAGSVDSPEDAAEPPVTAEPATDEPSEPSEPPAGDPPRS